MKMNFTIPNKPHIPIIQTQPLAVSNNVAVSTIHTVSNRVRPVVFGSLFELVQPTGPCTSCGYSK